MAIAFTKSGENSSTDRLLALIRSESDTHSDVQTAALPPFEKNRPRLGWGHLLPIRRRVAIGVDFSGHAIRMTKIARQNDVRHTLTDYASVPIPLDMPTYGDVFAKFLRSTLSSFCAADTQADIWTTISSAQVETRYLRIPKVPQRQLAKAAYWTYRREVPFDEGSTLFGFDHLGEVNDGGVRKLAIMAYTVPSSEVDAAHSLFKKAGHPLTGVTIVPFSLQNAMQSRWLETSGQSICTLYIGCDYSRIDIFEGRRMVISRVIKAGVRSMFDSLKEDLAERLGNDIHIEALLTPEQLADCERQDLSFSRMLAQHLNMPEEDIYSMVTPAMERLIGQVERTLKHYALNFDNNQVGHLYLFGEVRLDQRMADLIAEQFGIGCQIIDLFVGPHLKTAVPAPRLQAERNQLIPALSLALSSNAATPNFLFTQEDRFRLNRIAAIKRALAVVFAAALILMAAFGALQSHWADAAAAQIADLQQTLAQEKPSVDRDLVNMLAKQAQQKADETKSLAARYWPLALLSELSFLTPADIRLLQMQADGRDTPAGSVKETAPEAVQLKGIIFGDRLRLDIILAGYISHLNGSPLFSEAVIKDRTFKSYENRPALYFTIHLGWEQ